jgi:[ribosomal protein S18]-alanine N-acetyltransferase
VKTRTVNNEFLVRQYSEADFDQISVLWEKTGMGNRNRGDDALTIERSIEMGGTLLILEEKKTGRILGTSWMTFDGRRIHLHHFGLLPDYQGNGLSKILLEESLKFVKTKGYQVKLEVHESNIKAINLYKKFGFEYLGDYDVYIIRDIAKMNVK